ncbi:MAG: hypothetical protein RQ750_14280, partial [Roseovarius sp.]|nr:hypothetical protein [Roseovarius sp.]
MNDLFNSFMTGPDEKGRFGDFGGRFVSETLMPLILELEEQYERAKTDDEFWAEMHDLWTHYVGRPSPLYYADRLTQHFGGAKIYLKRDELNHTGAHKINNVLGQIILARRMGKKRIIAETGVPAVFVESTINPRTIDAVLEAVRAAGHEARVGG